MKLTEQHTAFLSTVSLEVEKAFLSYRLGMRVTEVRGSIPLCTEKQDTTSVLDAKPPWNGNSYPFATDAGSILIGKITGKRKSFILGEEKMKHDFIYIPLSECLFPSMTTIPPICLLALGVAERSGATAIWTRLRTR